MKEKILNLLSKPIKLKEVFKIMILFINFVLIDIFLSIICHAGIYEDDQSAYFFLTIYFFILFIYLLLLTEGE